MLLIWAKPTQGSGLKSSAQKTVRAWRQALALLQAIMWMWVPTSTVCSRLRMRRACSRLIVAEVPLLFALPAQLRQADMAMLGDLHKRLGDEVAGSGAGRRAWGRIVRTDPSIHSQQGTVKARKAVAI